MTGLMPRDGLNQNSRGTPALGEKLLQGYEEQESFLGSPAAGLTSTTAQRSISEQPGTVIGPYKLLQQIGEGGMGVVFMAEQSEPTLRTVARKIINRDVSRYVGDQHDLMRYVCAPGDAA